MGGVGDKHFFKRHTSLVQRERACVGLRCYICTGMSLKSHLSVSSTDINNVINVASGAKGEGALNLSSSALPLWLCVLLV